MWSFEVSIFPSCKISKMAFAPFHTQPSLYDSKTNIYLFENSLHHFKTTIQPLRVTTSHVVWKRFPNKFRGMAHGTAKFSCYFTLKMYRMPSVFLKALWIKVSIRWLILWGIVKLTHVEKSWTQAVSTWQDVTVLLCTFVVTPILAAAFLSMHPLLLFSPAGSWAGTDTKLRSDPCWQKWGLYLRPVAGVLHLTLPSGLTPAS